MSKPLEVKQLLDSAFAALASKGINVTGLKRSQLLTAIDAVEPGDHARIKELLSDVLGEPATDVMDAIAKLTAFKETVRQAIVAKGTLVTPAETLDQYAQKIRAIRSYSDLTFSGIMPDFILDPEPTGSTVVYMRPGATGDGSSWDNAMSDFVAAHASLTGTKNVIYMEEGVYPVTGLINLKVCKIYGGFKSTDHAWSSRNSFTNRTIVDAQLTDFRVNGASFGIVDGLTVINTRNATAGCWSNMYYCKNLIAQDCINTTATTGGGFTAANYCNNLIAINCSSYSGGGFSTTNHCNNLIAINCRASGGNGGGIFNATGCINLLILNCSSTTSGGGLYGATNCANAKIVNCSGTSNGSGTFADNNCKNILVLNCSGASAVYLTSNVSFQHYNVINCLCPYAIVLPGGIALSTPNKMVNAVCLNNKDTNGSLVGFRLNSANYYYKLYNCRADAAISFAANAATNADIQNFYYIQNNNSETKFINAGTYPIVGCLPYDNNVINQKYLDGNYGNFNIPADSVLAGAGYWEDGFSFGWDIDGKPRNASHCSIGAYEPDWA